MNKTRLPGVIADSDIFLNTRTAATTTFGVKLLILIEAIADTAKITSESTSTMFITVEIKHFELNVR